MIYVSRKPPTYRAIQYIGSNASEVLAFLRGTDHTHSVDPDGVPGIWIESHNTSMYVHIGDYIVDMGNGNCLPVPEGVFFELYQVVPRTNY